VKRQISLEQAISHCKDICVVLLDEAGLPQDPQNPLKATHFFLDHPTISTIILTNTILDAAKMNRAALLQLPNVPPSSDLLSLAKASLFGKQVVLADDSEQLAFVQAVCTAFSSCNKFTQGFKSNMYQQRDFIYFLRSLRVKSLETSTMNVSLSMDSLIQALQRNFGGVRTPFPSLNLFCL
jgi:E3 ubiquitin-protein ligase RNF213